MRISDWSSDVCSSDLSIASVHADANVRGILSEIRYHDAVGRLFSARNCDTVPMPGYVKIVNALAVGRGDELGRASFKRLAADICARARNSPFDIYQYRKSFM